MSFLPETTHQMIPGQGNQRADIMLIGDCQDSYARKQGKAISGPPESTLQDTLHQAGLTLSQIYYTNMFPDLHTNDLKKWWNTRTKKPIKDFSGYLQVLEKDIERVDPKVIVAIGEPSAYIFCGNGMVSKIRGYPFKWNDRIVIPTEHPRDMIWSNYISRFYLAHDLGKARKLYEHPRRIYTPEIETRIPQSFAEAKSTLEYIATFKTLSVDIEVANFEVSCIGFAVNSGLAYSIPFDMRWTLEEEVRLWNLVAKIMGDPEIKKIGQNFIFDIHFLLLRVGIFTRGEIVDTMMSHHIMYPEFLKGLNFLASVYTMQPYWKDMVKFKDIKAES